MSKYSQQNHMVAVFIMFGVTIVLLIVLSMIYTRLIQQKNYLLKLQQRYVAYIDQLQIEYGMKDDQAVVTGLPFSVYQHNKVIPSVMPPSLSSVRSNNPSLPKNTQISPKNTHAFMWPIKLDRFWLSSSYGMRKKKNGIQKFHYGIDLAALEGTEIYSAQAGIVYQTGYSPKGYGKYIKIRHQKGYETRYAHLSAIMVKKGQHIHKGTIIGKVGSTGAVWGKNASHLHFEVLAATVHVNPLSVLQ